MTCCITALRIITIIVAVIALVLAVVSLFFNLFEQNSTLLDSFHNLSSIVNDPSYDPSNDSSGVIYQFLKVLALPLNHSSMTLWEIDLQYPQDSRQTSLSGKQQLTEYFSCETGRLNIQVAQAMSTISCMLCTANVILSAFTFCMDRVIRFPLALYSFLAAAAAAISFGMMVHLNLTGWCDGPLQGLGFEFSKGFMLLVVSTAASVAVCVITAVRVKCW